MSETNFSDEQIIAMKVIIAIMLDRAHDRDFEFSSLGMEWLGAMNAPAVKDEDGKVVRIQDLFDASLVVGWSAISHLARTLEIDVDQVIQSFAVSIAEAELRDKSG